MKNPPINPEAPHPRCNEDISEYNKAVKDLLKGFHIEINDLYSPLMEDLRRYISKDMVHLTEAGNSRCASLVADLIRKK